MSFAGLQVNPFLTLSAWRGSSVSCSRKFVVLHLTLGLQSTGIIIFLRCEVEVMFRFFPYILIQLIFCLLLKVPLSMALLMNLFKTKF